MKKKKYYIQLLISPELNNILWLKERGCGYTVDIDNAGKYTKDEFEDVLKECNAAIMWECDYIDKQSYRTVDKYGMDTTKSVMWLGKKKSEKKNGK